MAAPSNNIRNRMNELAEYLFLKYQIEKGKTENYKTVGNNGGIWGGTKIHEIRRGLSIWLLLMDGDVINIALKASKPAQEHYSKEYKSALDKFTKLFNGKINSFLWTHRDGRRTDQLHSVEVTNMSNEEIKSIIDNLNEVAWI